MATIENSNSVELGIGFAEERLYRNRLTPPSRRTIAEKGGFSKAIAVLEEKKIPGRAVELFSENLYIACVARYIYDEPNFRDHEVVSHFDHCEEFFNSYWHLRKP